MELISTSLPLWHIAELGTTLSFTKGKNGLHLIAVILYTENKERIF
jgi:hypothetical protein